MKRIWIVALLLLATSCSSTHNISFLNEPCLKPYKNFDFELGTDFIVKVNDRIFKVPKDFITDLASVPRPMWAFYPPNDTRTIRAAVIHDYLYSGAVSLSRSEADSILYDALVIQGISRFTAYKYWIAVRVFGQSHFKEYLYKDCTIEEHKH